MLTVQQLITELNKVKDKSKPVRIERFIGENTVSISSVSEGKIRNNHKHGVILAKDSLPLPTDEEVIVIKGFQLY